MPIGKGITRRANRGRGATLTSSVSFSVSDKAYIDEQALMRKVSMAVIIEEAIALHRVEFAKADAAQHHEDKVNAIQAGKDRAKAARATSSPVPPAADEAPVNL